MLSFEVPSKINADSKEQCVVDSVVSEQTKPAFLNRAFVFAHMTISC